MFQHMLRGALVAVALLAPKAQGAFFDLRDAAIENIDDTDSFSLSIDGIVATLTAGVTNPTSTPGAVELNRTISGFGVNLTGSGFGTEDSDNVDGDQGEEFVQILFDQTVRVFEIHFSAMGTPDLGSVTVDGLAPIDFSTAMPLPLPAGVLGMQPTTTLLVSFEAGNGFSFDDFTVVAVPTPNAAAGAVVLLLALSVLAALRRRDTA